MHVSGDQNDEEIPTVSVVIAAYNAERWIGEAIESVRSQTYRDFEIIVVDDGSTDETAEVVAEYDDVRYVYKENGGSASARNRGIREARGRLIALHDADDLWEPDKLDRMVDLFKADAALAWAYSDAVVAAAESREPLYRTSSITPKPQGDVLGDLLKGNFIPVPTTLIRKEVFEEVGYFNESRLRRISEDWALWVRIAERHPVRYVDEPLVKIRMHPGRKTQTMDLEHALQSRLKTIEETVSRHPDRLGCELDRAAAHLLTNIGRKWLDREQRKEARRLFARAIRRRPWHVEAWLFGAASLVPRRLLRLLGRGRHLFRKAHLDER